MDLEINSGHLLESERKRTIEEVSRGSQQLPEEKAGAGAEPLHSQ